MLKENRTVGRSGKAFTNLGSNSTLNNLKFIQRIMQERLPQRTLEIGLAFGASTLVFCAEHQKLGRDGAKNTLPLIPFKLAIGMTKPGSLPSKERDLKTIWIAVQNFQSRAAPAFWKQASGMISFMWMARTCSRMSFSMPSIAPGCLMMAGCSSLTTRLIRTSPRRRLSFAAT